MIMDSQINNNHVNLQSSVQVNVSDLVKCFKTRKEARWFCQTNGKLILIKNIGLYLPDYSCFDTDFVLQYGNKSKCVSEFKF